MEPFPVPPHWPWWVGHDPGFNHPATVWFTMSPTGTLYVADEDCIAGRSIPQHAEAIKQRLPGRNVQGFFLDPQYGFSQTAFAVETLEDQFRACELNFQPWPRTGNHVQDQVEAVRKWLIAPPRGKPKLQVFRSCPVTISEFQSWSYKKAKDGEVLAGDDQYEDRNNHTLDVCRGIIATNPTYTTPEIKIARMAY